MQLNIISVLLCHDFDGNRAFHAMDVLLVYLYITSQFWGEA